MAGRAPRAFIARLMQFEDGPQLALTARRRVLVGVGVAMFLAQCGAAIALAPATTGAHADGARLATIWAASIVWSATAVLLLVRQTDLPDVATASFMVTISAFAIFALAGALHVRGTSSEVDIADAIFLGVTTGALTAVIVWALAMGAARALRLSATAASRDEASG